MELDPFARREGDSDTSINSLCGMFHPNELDALTVRSDDRPASVLLDHLTAAAGPGSITHPTLTSARRPLACLGAPAAGDQAKGASIQGR